MAETDDYERLLREVEQFTAGGKAASTPPAKQPVPATGAGAAATTPGEPGSQARLAWAGMSAVGGLVLGILLAILPFLGLQLALGAAIGAAAAAFLSGPPKWFDRD